MTQGSGGFGVDGGSPQLLRFEVLGPLRAWRGGAPLKLGPVKRQAVLATLLLHQGAVVSHERLLDSVWGEEPPAGSHKVLPTHVNSLRRVLDPEGTPPSESVIRSGKGWYRFVVEEVRIDTTDLDERGDEALSTVASGDLVTAAGQLSLAIGLFRGEPLAGVPGPFAREERQRLEERRRTFRLERLKCLVLLGRFGDALDDLSRLSASDRYDESLTALRMRALYGRGRQAEALRTYEDLRVRLRDELGTDPCEELRRVHEAVLHQDDVFLLRPPPSVFSAPRERAVPAELPHDTPGFAGRTGELDRLHSLLAPARAQKTANTVVISAIGGAAGIGKTALAVHWAHHVRDRFPDGQLYVNLHGFDHDRQPLEPGEALELLLRSLGFAASEIPPHHEAQSRVFRTLLADRRMLVLLDNAASAEQVRPLLPSGPTCCVLVTSRNRLGDLVAHDGAHAMPLDLLQPDEARALLSRTLGTDRVDDDKHAVDELIRLCGSLPLALRVAAARLAGDPGLRTADLVTEMTEGNKLEALEPDGDANSPLRTAFSVSYRVLAPAARRLFRLLGQFPGAEFTTEAAAALLDAPLPQARRLIGALVSAHLIEPATVGRYRFHDLLREYAWECALVEEAAPDREAALERLLIWYLNATRTAAGAGLFPELPSSLHPGTHPGMPSGTAPGPWLDAERANLLAVINHATRHGPRPVAWHLTSALFSDFWIHLPRKTWQTTAQTALDAAETESDLFGQAAMHSSLAAARWDRGHVRQAMEHATRAVDISREIGWATGEASGLGLRGFARWSMARLDSAHDDFTVGLRLFRETGHRYFEGFGVVGLGMACRDLGRLHEAADHLERAVGLAAEVSWWDARSALHILGGVYWELGRLTDGLDLLGPEVASDKRAGYRDGQAMMLGAIAKINVELGRHSEGLEQAERAFAQVEDTKRHWVQSGILNTVAAAHRRLAQADRALQAGEQALAMAREARFRRGEADSLLCLSLTYKETGRYDEARAHAELALALARDHSFRVVEGQALTALCETAEAEEAHGTAVELGQTALALHRETGHRLGEARTLMALARAHRKTGDGAAAELMRQQAWDIFSDIGVPESEYEGLDR
ncbi:BTAD domain-containing putative transcriptional regulator [Streptomyces sp. NBC_00038]|uniref:AfsR/SARP family transcriptional regulator n=1 Tax=Streptomyces sp. NBC_00038 TaxID=2903615 RepID=UPI00224CA125|nr:BTAD domain-containing putative transcriptional regulator [Streptomyces sp. NBC_00038]MCX5559287.1 winged helix-turn-helix domain-containing protein [Streptomyces sp. NBC_00038]